MPCRTVRCFRMRHDPAQGYHEAPMDISGMRRFVFAAASAALFGSLAIAEPATPQSASAVPDLSGMWGRNRFNFSKPESGPGPVKNSKQVPSDAREYARIVDYYNPVGDYSSPILKPDAAEAVRRAGEATLRGKQFPSPSTQCALYTPPYGMSMMLELQRTKYLFSLRKIKACGTSD